MADDDDEKGPRFPVSEPLKDRLQREVQNGTKTQTALAVACGVSIHTIRQVLSKTDPKIVSTHILPRLCTELNIDMFDYLLPEESQRRVTSRRSHPGPGHRIPSVSPPPRRRGRGEPRRHRPDERFGWNLFPLPNRRRH